MALGFGSDMGETAAARTASGFPCRRPVALAESGADGDGGGGERHGGVEGKGDEGGEGGSGPTARAEVGWAATATAAAGWVTVAAARAHRQTSGRPSGRRSWLSD